MTISDKRKYIDRFIDTSRLTDKNIIDIFKKINEREFYKC